MSDIVENLRNLATINTAFNVHPAAPVTPREHRVEWVAGDEILALRERIVELDGEVLELVDDLELATGRNDDLQEKCAKLEAKIRSAYLAGWGDVVECGFVSAEEERKSREWHCQQYMDSTTEK